VACFDLGGDQCWRSGFDGLAPTMMNALPDGLAIRHRRFSDASLVNSSRRVSGFGVGFGGVGLRHGQHCSRWFFLCLLLTPLAILVLLALPTLKPPEPPEPQFEPTAVLKGFPYRLLRDGTVEAMMTGGLVHFRNMILFRAAAEGRDAEMTHDDTVKAEFTDELHGYFYRVEKDGSVSAVDRLGARIKFGDWRSFWETAGRPD
jgi:hypothetical protein